LISTDIDSWNSTATYDYQDMKQPKSKLETNLTCFCWGISSCYMSPWLCQFGLESDM